MAAGSIVVDLLMRTGSFETDTGRAEKRLRQFEKNVVDAGSRIAAGVGAIAAAIGGSIAIVDQFAQSIGQYQDIAEKIGDAASAVASLQLAADQSGTALDTVASASVRLTAALAKADDESAGVAKALAAINIPLQDFKALSPVEQLDRVARELAKFEDGAAKTAVAVQLFRKDGAELIPFLNDLADAQGRNITLTDDQIASADEFSKTLATMRSELSTTAKVVAAELIPSFQAFLDYVRDTETGTTLLHAAGAVLRAVFETLAVVAANVAFVFVGVGREIGAIAAQIAALARLDIQGFRAISAAVKEDAARARAELDAFERRILGLNVTPRFSPDDQSEAESRRLGLSRPTIDPGNDKLQKYLEGLEKQIGLTKRLSNEQRAQADIAAGALGALTKAQEGQVLAAARALDKASAARSGGTRASAPAAPRMSEAERYLETLQKQLERTQDLSVTEQLLADIQAGRLGKVTSAQQAALVGAAEQIDAARRLSDQLKAEDQQLRDLAQSQEAVRSAGAAVYEATRTPLERLGAEQARLNELLQKGAIDWDTYSRAVFNAQDAYDRTTAAAGKTAETVDTFSKRFAENAQDQLGQGLYDLMSGNFKNIGDGFVDMINRMVAEAIAADIAKALFGDLLKGGEGGGVFDSIFKSFQGALGSAGSGSGSSGGGGLVQTLGSLFGSFFGGGKAGGGDVIGGRSYLVGEQGPEMFVPRTAGLIVPHQQAKEMGGRSVSINNNFTVSGQVDRRTQEQIALSVCRSVSMAQAGGG
jgi:hypothetical protein